MNSFRRVGPTFLAVALIAGIAGCGKFGGPGSGSASADPLAGLSADAIAREALANTSAATTVHLAGTVTSSGRTITISETIADSGRQCAGTYSVRGQGTVQLVMIGTTVWMKPDAAFWQAYGPPAAVLSQANGKWIKSSTTTAGMASMARMCSLKAMASNTSVSAATADEGPITMVDGVPTVVITDTTDGSSLYATDTVHPLVTRLTGPSAGTAGQSTGSIELGGYGAATTIKPPPASMVVTLSQLGL